LLKDLTDVIPVIGSTILFGRNVKFIAQKTWQVLWFYIKR